MFQKQADLKVEDKTPELDEGWWASVLADEIAQADTVKETTAKPTPHQNVNKVDWDYVRNLYDHDEIVDLEVQGYNRGGLLVQSENIQGFVPISHLVDMPNNTNEEERIKLLPAYVGKTLS